MAPRLVRAAPEAVTNRWSACTFPCAETTVILRKLAKNQASTPTHQLQTVDRPVQNALIWRAGTTVGCKLLLYSTLPIFFPKHIFFIVVKYIQHKIYHLNHFKVYSSVAFSKSTICATITTIKVQNVFITPGRTPYPLAVTPLSPSSWPPLIIYFLSLKICLLWAFHVKGIIQYVVLCDWFLPLRTMFSRCIHTEAGASTSFFSFSFFIVVKYT